MHPHLELLLGVAEKTPLLLRREVTYGYMFGQCWVGSICIVAVTHFLTGISETLQENTFAWLTHSCLLGWAPHRVRRSHEVHSLCIAPWAIRHLRGKRKCGEGFSPTSQDVHGPILMSDVTSLASYANKPHDLNSPATKT